VQASMTEETKKAKVFRPSLRLGRSKTSHSAHLKKYGPLSARIDLPRGRRPAGWLGIHRLAAAFFPYSAPRLHR